MAEDLRQREWLFHVDIAPERLTSQRIASETLGCAYRAIQDNVKDMNGCFLMLVLVKRPND